MLQHSLHPPPGLPFPIVVPWKQAQPQAIFPQPVVNPGAIPGPSLAKPQPAQIAPLPNGNFGGGMYQINQQQPAQHQYGHIQNILPQQYAPSAAPTVPPAVPPTVPIAVPPTQAASQSIGAFKPSLLNLPDLTQPPPILQPSKPYIPLPHILGSKPASQKTSVDGSLLACPIYSLPISITTSKIIYSVAGGSRRPPVSKQVPLLPAIDLHRSFYIPGQSYPDNKVLLNAPPANLITTKTTDTQKETNDFNQKLAKILGTPKKGELSSQQEPQPKVHCNDNRSGQQATFGANSLPIFQSHMQPSYGTSHKVVVQASPIKPVPITEKANVQIYQRQQPTLQYAQRHRPTCSVLPH